VTLFIHDAIRPQNGKRKTLCEGVAAPQLEDCCWMFPWVLRRSTQGYAMAATPWLG